MAFRKEGFTATSEVQGGTRIVKVKEWHVYSLPSETYFQFRRPATLPMATVNSVAGQFSDRIEGVLALPGVTDVVYSQDVTPGGQLKDMMTTYYEADGGLIEDSVSSDLAHFGPNFTGAQIDTELGESGGAVDAGAGGGGGPLRTQ